MAEEQKIVNLEVQVEKKEGKNGPYTVTFVKANGKDWQISKRDLEKVQVGLNYDFILNVSDYNGKPYNWANLVEKKSIATEITGEDVKNYFAKLDKDKQQNMIKWMIENIK